jgi:DNA-binding HxlR family transcriptional regulator
MLAIEGLPEKRMSHEQLLRLFPYDKLLEPRMTDLENNGFVVRRGTYYELTPKGWTRAVVAGKLKRFLQLEPGG